MRDGKRRPWGLTAGTIHFVTDADAGLYGEEDDELTLREFWAESYPAMVEWYDGPEPLLVADSGTMLWVKDSWLSQ